MVYAQYACEASLRKGSIFFQASNHMKEFMFFTDCPFSSFQSWQWDVKHISGAGNIYDPAIHRVAP
jgi:hypothetical protein